MRLTELSFKRVTYEADCAQCTIVTVTNQQVYLHVELNRCELCERCYGSHSQSSLLINGCVILKAPASADRDGSF